jgi:hypothetical protein
MANEDENLANNKENCSKILFHISKNKRYLPTKVNFQISDNLTENCDQINDF